MKKSNIILIIILGLFIILPAVIMFHLSIDVKAFINNKFDEKLTKKIDLPENLRAIVLKNKSSVLLESSESKNSITIANSDAYTVEGDTLYIDTKSKMNTKLNLTAYNYIELNNDSSLKIGETQSKTKELTINLKDSSKFRTSQLGLEKFNIDASTNAKASVSMIRCDSLFLTANSDVNISVKVRNRIKYFSGKIKGTSKVRVSTPNKIEVETEDTAELRLN